MIRHRDEVTTDPAPEGRRRLVTRACGSRQGKSREHTGAASVEEREDTSRCLLEVFLWLFALMTQDSGQRPPPPFIGGSRYPGL